jgi:hypothetical protein
MCRLRAAGRAMRMRMLKVRWYFIAIGILCGWFGVSLWVTVGICGLIGAFGAWLEDRGGRKIKP